MEKTPPTSASTLKRKNISSHNINRVFFFLNNSCLSILTKFKLHIFAWKPSWALIWFTCTRCLMLGYCNYEFYFYQKKLQTTVLFFCDIKHATNAVEKIKRIDWLNHVIIYCHSKPEPFCKTQEKIVSSFSMLFSMLQ